MSDLESLLEIKAPSPEQKLNTSWIGQDLPEVWVKRDDLLHPVISGNKWRKLKYALQHAIDNNIKHIVSFGGGFSNHLHALGYCCYKLNIQFTAIVRGDYTRNPTPTLGDLNAWGADIVYVDRATYGKRSDSEYIKEVSARYHAWVIPEGGSQHEALAGVGEIVTELGRSYDHILCPVGSGGTLAGLIQVQGASHTDSKITGIAVLKGQGYLEELVGAFLPKNITLPEWHIEHTFHFGGYAKQPEPLTTFCDSFTQNTGIPVEPVYSGKLAYALCEMLRQNHFAQNNRVLFLHTGGLQGNR